jgi:hypothetical protein
MMRCGCSNEDKQFSQHSPGVVTDDESLVFVTEGDEISFKLFSNGRLKDTRLSVCRAQHATFAEMITAVIGDPPKKAYKGYMWAPTREVRAILARRNSARDKTPNQTPKKVGAFCVADDGEQNYKAHACIGYSTPTKNFWELHDTVAARGDLLIAFSTRGVIQIAISPPF